MITEKEIAVVDRALHDIYEFFPEVQIFASRVATEGGTERYYLGIGNWYARKGMAQAFLERDNQLESAQAIAKELKDQN